MFRKSQIIIAIAILMVFAGCSDTRGTADVDLGKSYVSVNFIIDKTSKFEPVIAIWIENPQNGETAVLYHTDKAGVRDLALPVWSELESDDAVSGATPKEPEFSKSFQIPDKFAGNSFIIYIEANVSYDYNEYYVENAKTSDTCYSDVNGQPSVIWKGVIRAFTGADGLVRINPSIAGHGDVLGKNNQISDEIGKITTAARILKDFDIIYHPM